MLSIYINTWGNYNENGADGGEWVRLPRDEDELQNKLDEIANAMGDSDPEFFINDVDNSSGIDFNIGENDDIFELNEKLQAVADLDKWESEIYAAACEYFGAEYVDIDNIDEYNLYTDIRDEYDLGYYWAEESGCYRLEGPLANYFDYEAFGRDIALEADGGFTSYGFIEKI